MPLQDQGHLLGRSQNSCAEPTCQALRHSSWKHSFIGLTMWLGIGWQKMVVFPKLATGAQNIGCPLKGFKDSLKVYRGLCGIPSLGCNTPHCLEKGHSRLWWTGAVQPKSEATSPQGEETQPKYYCHMPSVWSHPCFQLGAVFSPTVSLTSSSLALNFHETHAIIIFIHSSKMKLCWSLYK